MILLYCEKRNTFKIQFQNDIDFEIIGTNKDYDYYRDFVMNICKIDNLNLTKVKKEYIQYSKMRNKAL